jgi:hypothetical protein
MARHVVGSSAGFLAALLVAAAAGAQPHFTLEGRYWDGRLDVSARVSDGAIGTVFDFKDDLGLADTALPEGRFVWTFGPHTRFELSYLQVGYDGDATVTRTIVFRGTTYTVGTRVLTTLDERYLRAGWVWQFVDVGDGTFRFGTVLELKRLSIAATLAAPELDPPVRQADTIEGVLPAAGLAIDVSPHRGVDIFLEGSGVDAGTRGSMVDAEAGVRYYPTAAVGVLLSYRILDLRLRSDPDYAKLRITGPFAGLSVRW